MLKTGRLSPVIVEIGDKLSNLALKGRRQKRGTTGWEGDHQKHESANAAFSSQPTMYVCRRCGRDCHARVGLLRHARRCIYHRSDNNFGANHCLTGQTDAIHVLNVNVCSFPKLPGFHAYGYTLTFSLLRLGLPDIIVDPTLL